MTTSFERLGAALLRDYGLQPHQLTMDSSLESLGIDSLATVELMWNIEDEFQITLPAQAMEFHTLGDVVSYVDMLVARKDVLALARAPASAVLGAG